MTTNYERIKSMNIEELANYMTNFVLNSIALNSNRQNLQVTCDVMETYNQILKFINKESEE